MEHANGDAKRLAIEVIGRLSEDATLEDIASSLVVVAKVQRGLEDIENGRVVTDEEARRRFAKWLNVSDSQSVQSASSADRSAKPND